jgi:hypothetical protein
MEATIADTMLRARKSVIDHLTGVSATNADGAVIYQPQRHAERRALSYLLSHQVVRMTTEGRYWLSEDGAAAWRSDNRTRTAWMIGGALAAVAGLVVVRQIRKKRSERSNVTPATRDEAASPPE